MPYKDYGKTKEHSRKYYYLHKKDICNYKRIEMEKFKQQFKNLKINGCAICGYNKCMAALDFHHVNPKYKIFLVNIFSFKHKSLQHFIEELNKCILLCSNCHRELHNPPKL